MQAINLNNNLVNLVWLAKITLWLAYSQLRQLEVCLYLWLGISDSHGLHGSQIMRAMISVGLLKTLVSLTLCTVR